MNVVHDFVSFVVIFFFTLKSQVNLFDLLGMFLFRSYVRGRFRPQKENRPPLRICITILTNKTIQSIILVFSEYIKN